MLTFVANLNLVSPAFGSFYVTAALSICFVRICVDAFAAATVLVPLFRSILILIMELLVKAYCFFILLIHALSLT